MENKVNEMRLHRLTLFSSGVGFFENSGDLEGSTELTLPFNKAAVNDALKSLVINDPDANPTVSYHSDDTLQRTMEGLAIDLIGNSHLAQLLNSLRGAEIEVLIPTPLRGRLLLVEYRDTPDSCKSSSDTEQRVAFVSLLTAEGIRIISLNEIGGFTFIDQKINADANRALDLIMQSRDSGIRNLNVKLQGQKSRKVSLSYVIPTPIWKVSYRLDLSKKKPLLQGWAVVDNDSDTDWDGVELALVTGRPSSFIQNLYAPYYVHRPTLPLSIAGTAKAHAYESGTTKYAKREASREGSYAALPGGRSTYTSPSGSASIYSISEAESDSASDSSPSELNFLMSLEDEIFSPRESALETARGRSAGEQFEFTIKTPVSLARQQSAMLPLVEGSVYAEKRLVFSGNNSNRGKSMNPAIGAVLINNTGMKLPAGAITVFDGGTYAGDALIEFFPEEEKRIISYGEDLTVTGSFSTASSTTINAVSVKDHNMYLETSELYKRTYVFRNASSETKRLVIEHPYVSHKATLVEPSEYMEKTHDFYRFEMSLPHGESRLEVSENEIQKDEIDLSDSSEILLYNIDEILLLDSSNNELREDVCTALRQVVALKQNIEIEREKLADCRTRLTHLLEEQERTRKNLEAAGSQTQQGVYYLNRLVAQDNEIDEVHNEIATVEQAIKDAQSVLDKFIEEMTF